MPRASGIAPPGESGLSHAAPARHVTSLRRACRTAVAAVSVLLAAVAIGSLTWDPANWRPLLAFHASCAALVLLAWPRPRADSYTVLALFLWAGFWLKFVAHGVFAYPFLEPIGAFDGSSESWRRVFVIAAAGISGAAFATGHMARAPARPPPRSTDEDAYVVPPAWYSARVRTVWIGLLAVLLAIYVANFHYAFFQTGVNTRLVLPLKLNVLLSWACYCGIPLAVALAGGWELGRRPGHFALMIISVAILGVVASASLASRATTVFLMLAYVAAFLSHMPVRRVQIVRQWTWRLPAIMAATLCLSLLVVSWFRLDTYVVAPPVPTAVQAGAGTSMERPGVGGAAGAGSTGVGLAMTRSHMFRQVMLLASDRWVGLEGVLAVAGSTDVSPGAPLFVAGLREPATNGVDSIYQRIAHSQYVYLPNFTYLTLPGAVAVLAYSGAPAVVFGGMFVLVTDRDAH